VYPSREITAVSYARERNAGGTNNARSTEAIAPITRSSVSRGVSRRIEEINEEFRSDGVFIAASQMYSCAVDGDRQMPFIQRKRADCRGSIRISENKREGESD
jgi:hypothetical protein